MLDAVVFSSSLGLTFVIGTFAAVCFVVAALGPITPRWRAGIAIAGIFIDWIPVAAGWMAVADPSHLLLTLHFGFGIVGYALLLYCLIGWIRGDERSLYTRAAFVCIWGIAYLAGVLMVVDSILL